ncbi:hypothetical protein D9M69_394410 [compost metagenome]
MQRGQQALLVVERQALSPQRVVLVEHAELGLLAMQAVEHLQAVRTAERQDQRQLVALQGVAVEVQRAEGGARLAQVLEQRRQVGQRGMPHLAGLQVDQMVVLAHLHQVATAATGEEMLEHVVEQHLDPFGDRRRAVAAEAAHPQRRQRPAGRQAVEVVAQAIEQRGGAVVAADQQFVPAVQADLVEGQHQVLAHPGIAQRVGAAAGQVYVQLAVLPERVDADVDQQQHLARRRRPQQGVFLDRRQRQREALLQADQQVVQLELAEVAGAGMQGQPRAGVDHAVAVAPGEQFAEHPAALERGEVRPFLGAQAAGVQRPDAVLGIVRRRAVDQGEVVLGEVRGDPRVDELDLAGLALEGRVQAPAEHAEVAAVERAGDLLVAGELGEEAVAVGQLVDQHAPLAADLADLPLAAAVELGQVPRRPGPGRGQALEQQALPALAAVARRAAELLADLQVQAAADQLQALALAASGQVLLQAAVDHDVGVELVEVQAVGEHRLLEAQGQAFHLRVLAGVDLGEQQLEHRLVGRLDALEQLPHAGADEFAGRDVRQVAEVQHLLGADETLGEQRLAVLDVARLLVYRHQPPERGAPGEPDGGAVELVEQQVVLGGAAVVGGQPRFAGAAGEARRVDQEAVHLGALGRRPGFQQLALAAQFGERGGRQLRVVADPQVHVADLGLRHGAQAAHQEQAVDRSLRLAAEAALRLVDERAGQPLRFGEQSLVRLEAAQPGRGAGRRITGQQRMVDVEQQRQQAQDQLLAHRQRLLGAQQAALVDLEEARAQLRQHLAVDAVVDVRADFLAARHGLRRSKKEHSLAGREAVLLYRRGRGLA